MTTSNAGSLIDPHGAFTDALQGRVPAPFTSPEQLSIQQKKRLRVGERYYKFLCIVLLGYALAGRGFAYIGVNPLFIGEFSLLVGVVVLLRIRVISKLTSIREFIPLVLFMFWGLCCTVPYLDKYQKDAIRDAVVWGYGTFAFIVAGLLIAEPTRVQRLVLRYKKFIFWFLILAPLSSIAVSFFEESLPTIPGTGVPIIQVKGGDLCVHLAGCFAFIVTLGGGINPWLYALMLPLNLGLNIQGRSGMVSFALSAAACTIFKPFNPRALRMYLVVTLGLFFLWASNLRIQKGARELSADFLVKAISSIYQDNDDEALEGSKEWRKRWWGDIINYTFHGPYFWTGKGFGINLANDDGYQVDEMEALRSPHNGHLTMLARAGVPGFSFWCLLQLTWATVMLRAYFRARSRRLNNWSGLFLFLGCYWAAFLANAAFDVFLEGPMGGIWFWCIYGAGIGSIQVFRKHPDLLTPVRPVVVPLPLQRTPVR